MEPAGSPAEVADRVRASLAYRNIDSKTDVGAIAASTIARLKSRSDTRTASGPECEVLASELDVPLDFLLLGFTPMEAPLTDSARRVMALERRVAALEARPPGAAGRRKPPGELGRRASSSDSKAGGRPRAPKKRAAGGRKGSGG